MTLQWQVLISLMKIFVSKTNSSIDSELRVKIYSDIQRYSALITFRGQCFGETFYTMGEGFVLEGWLLLLEK